MPNAALAKQQSDAADKAMADAREKARIDMEEAARYQGMQAACKPDAKTSIRESVAKARQNAEFDFLLSADLPAQAKQCELRTGACAEAGQVIRKLLQDGDIEVAQKGIADAKRLGCNMSDLEKEFDDYKTIRDAAVYIEALNAACRFQDAVNFAKQYPQLASKSDIVRQATFRSNDGLAAQQKVNAYLNAAEASTTAAQIDQNLRAAEQEALRFSCLLTLVTKVRAGIRLPVTTTTTTGTTSGATGPLVAKITVTPNKNGVDGAGRIFAVTFTETSANYDFRNPTDKTQDVTVHWDYNGLSKSLSPGDRITIRVTGGVVKEWKPDWYGGTLAGGVTVYGDIDVKSAQQADKGHKEGVYELVVKPNAKAIEIHFGGAPMATVAIWKYGNAK